MLMEKSDKINHTFQFSRCKTRKIFEGWLRIVFSWYSHMKFWTLYRQWWGFPGGSGGKKSSCQCRRCRRLGFDPWVGKILWRRKWQPTLVFLPGKFCVQRSLVGYSPWGHKESDITEQLSTRNEHYYNYYNSDLQNGPENALLSIANPIIHNSHTIKIPFKQFGPFC